MKRVPEKGIVGEQAFREAAASEFGSVCELVRRALRDTFPNTYLDVHAIYPDRLVARHDGRFYAYPYSISDGNLVTLGPPSEVVVNHTPVAAAATVREAHAGAPSPQPSDATPASTAPPAVSGAEGCFLEAVDAAAEKPSKFLVRVIRAGVSGNKVRYRDAVLREAAPLFNGARVFAKSDEEHTAGKGKDVRQLVGRLVEARFVEGKGADQGEIQAVFEALDSVPVTAQIREAVARGMTDLFGLSIDVKGKFQVKGAIREAVSFDKVVSVDLIVEPGAGGQVMRFIESHTEQESSDMTRQQKIAFIAKRNSQKAAALASADDAAVDTAFREAIEAEPEPQPGTAREAVSPDQVNSIVAQAVAAANARLNARAKIANAKLPAAARERLAARFDGEASFTEAQVDEAITAEQQYLSRVTESAAVRGLGIDAQAGEDRSEKVANQLADFFSGKNSRMSFREAYVEITGDRDVTGLIQNCDVGRLREALAGDFREAISAATFANILGNSITRAMIEQYNNLEAYQDWQWLVDIVPVRDFRTQERVRMGGYGNLPTVAENGAYNALTSPGDDKATYAVSKRGGVETISLETIANDDVGAIRRVPQSLAVAAGRTLYEFIYDFLATNAVIYDTLALFVAGHNNLGVTALSAASFSAARLRMKRQTELSSAKRLGLTLRHLVVPSDLEETAYDLFVRASNNDDTFVQSRKPTVHVVDYWTDTNNWFATADKSQVPLIELGFYGSQEPEIFVQDLPTQGSLFSNDQIKYKIRHIYGGAVKDFRGFDGSIVP